MSFLSEKGFLFLVVVCQIGCGGWDSSCSSLSENPATCIMPSQPPSAVSTSCLRGVNQNRDNASMDQCFDAQNVWSVNGIVEQRPGSIGISNITLQNSFSATTAPIIVKENPIGTFTILSAGGSLSALPSGSRVYLGTSSPNIGGIAYFLGQANSAKTRRYVEYYNGTTWKNLDAIESGSLILVTSGITVAARVSNYAFSQLPPKDTWTFVPPADWANTSSINSAITGYFIRITLTENALSGGTGLSGILLATSCPTTPGKFGGAFVASLPVGRFYVAVSSPSTGTAYFTLQSGGFYPGQVIWTDEIVDSSIVSNSAKASWVSVLASQDVYVSYGKKTFHIQPLIAATQTIYGTGNNYFTPTVPSGIFTEAQVESNPLIVGPGATYDSNVTAQLTTWPTAKVILYHDNQLWAIDDGIVRWSGQDADVIGHNVWPSLQFEYLQGDSSPTVGAVSAFNRVWIFKQNAIYASVLQGIDPNFGNVIYTFQRIVSGRGAVAINSIFPYGDNQLAFLSEDGIWKLDSTGQMRRLTLAPSVHSDAQGNQFMVDRLINYFTPGSPTLINPSARSGATGIDWSTKGVFLISVPTGSSTVNDTTLVYDYRQDSWWIWRGATPGTNFTPAYWFKEFNQAGVETLYYADTNGYIYQMVDGALTDHGAAINPYVTLEPIGYKDGTQQQLRKVNIDATNDAGIIQIDAFVDDRMDTARATAKINRFTDWREAVYSLPGGGTPTIQQDIYTHVATFSVDKYSAVRARRRMKTFGFAGTQATNNSVIFRMLNLKISNPTPGSHFRIGKIEALLQPMGRRPG